MATTTVPFPGGTMPTDIDGWTDYARRCLQGAALPIFNPGVATAGGIATSTALSDTKEYDRFKVITNLPATSHVYLHLEQTGQNTMTTVMSLPNDYFQTLIAHGGTVVDSTGTDVNVILNITEHMAAVRFRAMVCERRAPH